MRIEAPIPILSGLSEEGYLLPRNWPSIYSAFAMQNDGVELAILVGDAVRDREDLIPFPGAAHVLAETIANWWGAHQWMYPGQSVLLRIGSADKPLFPTIRQLADVLEADCEELKDGHWWWHDQVGNGPVPIITWKALDVEITFALGDNVTVSYPALSPDSKEQVTSRIRHALLERVAVFDETTDPEAVVVWISYPNDEGSTSQERLASAAPIGSMPRSLRLLHHREKRSD